MGVTLVEQVRPELTFRLRQLVLRPGRPAEEAFFPGDHDATSGHFAAYVDHVVVGVASVLSEAEPDREAEPQAGAGVWRLRGMAVDPEHRGAGAGLSLLARVRDFVSRSGGGLIWCNARVSALGFYEGAGFVTVGEQWEEPGIGAHVRMHDSLS